MSLVQYQYIDPALLLDKYHPANAAFHKYQRSIQQAVVHQTSLCTAGHVEIAKLHIRGLKNTDIAAQVNQSPGNISLVLHRPEVLHLIELLQFYSMHMEGPSIEHRKRQLHEIAVDNQADEPNVAISAIREMNRMDGVGKETKDHQINITINNQQLPRGALDR